MCRGRSTTKVTTVYCNRAGMRYFHPSQDCREGKDTFPEGVAIDLNHPRVPRPHSIWKMLTSPTQSSGTLSSPVAWSCTTAYVKEFALPFIWTAVHEIHSYLDALVFDCGPSRSTPPFRLCDEYVYPANYVTTTLFPPFHLKLVCQSVLISYPASQQVRWTEGRERFNINGFL